MKEFLNKIGKKLHLLFFSKFDLYFYKELLPNYIFGLSFFTLLIMLNELFYLTKYYFEYHIPMSQVMMLLLNLIPFLLSFSIPFGVLPAYLLTMGRLSQDSEIVAMRSCGVSSWRIILPGFLFGVLISISAMFFKDNIEVQANLNYIRLKAKMMSSKPAVELKENSFLELGGYKISFERMENEGDIEILYNIHIVDITGRKTIEAEKGRFFSDPENPEHYILKFQNGSISEVTIQKDAETQEESEHFFISSFKYLSINSYVDLPSDYYSKSPDTMTLAEVRKEIKIRSKGPQTKISNELIVMAKIDDKIKKDKIKFKKDSKKWDKKRKQAEKKKFKQRMDSYKKQQEAIDKRLVQHRKTLPTYYLMKVHDKYAMPFASFVFVIISLSVGMYTARSGRGEGLGLSIIIMMVFYGMKVGTENMIIKQVLPPVAEWIPNIVFLTAGTILLIRKMRH